MWRPATREVTGTNDGKVSPRQHLHSLTISHLVPLGTRRRFGPAPAEETSRPQLAQPSPSAYPKQSNQEQDSRRGREETPTNSPGKPINPLNTDFPSRASLASISLSQVFD